MIGKENRQMFHIQKTYLTRMKEIWGFACLKFVGGLLHSEEDDDCVIQPRAAATTFSDCMN